MAITAERTTANSNPLAGALLIIARASIGLIRHALVHPGRLALIDRRTGKVRPR